LVRRGQDRAGLARWKFERDVLTRQASGELGLNRIIERPKVIFNRSTNQYVMYTHVDTATGRAAF